MSFYDECFYDECFARLMGSEGGYSNNPKDPGGETNWGISKRSYPELDIKNVTRDAAKAIYRQNFWDKCRCDELFPVLAFALFDFAVNSGCGQAVELLQRAVGVAEDGVLGRVTMRRINEEDATTLTTKYLGYRLQFMTGLRPWDTFSKGWARRIAEQLVNL